jgi:DNA replication protein DnaC
MDGNMGQVVELQRRSLTKDDLVRMRLPKRFWNVDCDGVSDYKDEKEPRSARDMLTSYIQSMDEMKARGLGLLLWGGNGTGKSSFAAIIGKEFRRRFNTVLFIEAATLKGLVASNDYFDEDQSYWQRAKEVDVLILDDLGKGIQDSKNFGEQIVDELIRARNSNKLITIITTNVLLKGEGEKLSALLKPSTIHALKEHVLPIYFRGVDRREKIALENRMLLVD